METTLPGPLRRTACCDMPLFHRILLDVALLRSQPVVVFGRRVGDRTILLFLYHHPGRSHVEGLCFRRPRTNHRWCLCRIPQALSARYPHGIDLRALWHFAAPADDLLCRHAYRRNGHCRDRHGMSSQRMERTCNQSGDPRCMSRAHLWHTVHKHEDESRLPQADHAWRTQRVDAKRSDCTASRFGYQIRYRLELRYRRDDDVPYPELGRWIESLQCRTGFSSRSGIEENAYR